MSLRRTAFVTLLATLGLALPLAADSGSLAEAQPTQSEWGPLPSEVAATLAAKVEGYRARALGFSCRESIRTTSYDRQGHAGRERITEYDYLLVREPNAPGGFVALRTKPGSGDTEGKRVEVPFPEPYLWPELFSRGVRSTLRYRVGTWHTTPWRLAMPIDWTSAAPVGEKNRITEWSGRIEVEFRTGNVIRVVARPNMQDARLLAELDRFLKAFRVIGISTAPPPLGLELTVDFRFEHDGYLYPSRVEAHTFRQVHRDTRLTVSRTIATYEDYRFFGTTVDDSSPPFLYQPPAEGTEPEAPEGPNPFDNLDDLFGDS